MQRSEFLRGFEEASGLQEGSLQEDLTLKEINGWDSMAALVFISYVEEHFEMVVEGDQVARAVKVKDLLNLLGNKLG
jgi:acyl carrier protein